MLLLLAHILLIATCALALCAYAGWGAARLALPASLRPLGALFAPLAGYAIAIYAGYLGVSTALSLRWSLVLLLALATTLNALAWRQTGRPRPVAALREHAAPLALGALTLLVGVLPLLHYGYMTTIGQGWDTESYLPLAQHLVDYPLARIGAAPVNPLRGLVSDPPRIGVTLAFSVLQGMTMLLSGQTALATFAPLLALLRALGILAIYAWLRATMGLGRAAALLGAALASAGALLLWISYFNFGMQMSAWPLLGLGLALGVAAVEELARPAMFERSNVQTFKRSNVHRLGVALLAAVALAALPVAYYPALTICAPLAAGLGAARLAESFRRRDGQPRPSGLLLGALALGATTLLLAAPTVLDYFKGFAFRYSLIDQHIGPDRFIAFTETIGLQSFRLANDGPQPPATLVWLAAALAGAFALAGLLIPTTADQPILERSNVPTFQRSNVGRWLGLIAAALAYLVWLRFGRPYEYAYMKGSAYAGFVAWGLFTLGAQALWRRAGRAARPIVAGLALVPLLTAGWAQALTVRDHWAGPALFRRDIAAFDQDATRLVPRGATVAISGDASLTGPDSGLLCAMLYGREIWGRFAIAYGGHAYWPEGRLPQYALLAAGERAWPLDLGGRELWRSDELALYQLGGAAPTLMGRAEFYSAAPATSRSAPAPLDIWRRGGPNRAAASASPLTLLVGETLRFGPGQPDGGAAVQQLRLTVASLDDQRVAIGSGATTTQLDLRAGVSRLDLPVQAPAAVAIVPESALALIDAATLPGVASAPPSASLDEGQVAWTAAAEQRGATIQVRVRLANPGRHALRIALTVVEDTFNSPNSLAQVLAAAPLGDTWQLTLDPAHGATEARVGAAPTPMLHASATPNPPDGRYFGVLALYDGEESVAHAPIFTLSMAGGKLAALDPLPFTVEATPAGRPTAPLPGHRRALLDGPARALGDGQAALDAAVLQRWMAWPGAPGDAPLDRGAPLTVQLFWHALQPNARPTMISIQALDRENRKWAQWDGALGGDWRPIQLWQAGERVRQDVPLMFDPATPPGAYRLVLVAYDPATGQAQPLGGENMLSLGELVVR